MIYIIVYILKLFVKRYTIFIKHSPRFQPWVHNANPQQHVTQRTQLKPWAMFKKLLLQIVFKHKL